MSVSVKEAQELVDQRLPILGWIDVGSGLFTTAGPEVYGIKIVKEFYKKGRWSYRFESMRPVPVEEAIAHPRGVVVKQPEV